MEQLIENCFSWPSWPATVMVLTVSAYWLFAMLGAVDLDTVDLDLDIDIDVDADPSVLDLGFVPLRFLNLGHVPLMLWVSIFSLSAWIMSRAINSPLPHDTFNWMSDGQALLRDFGLAAIITKFVTQPLRGRFKVVEPNLAKDLIGNTCVVTTSEVTDSFGEAEYVTDGAPLKLSVRTADESLTKGDTAVIVDFTPEKNLYFVKRANQGA